MHQIRGNLSVKVDAEYAPIEASSLTYFETLRTTLRKDFPEAEIKILRQERRKGSVEYLCIVSLVFNAVQAYSIALSIVQGTTYLKDIGEVAARKEHGDNTQIVSSEVHDLEALEISPYKKENLRSRFYNLVRSPIWIVLFLAITIFYILTLLQATNPKRGGFGLNEASDQLIIIVPNNRSGPTTIRSLSDQPVEIEIQGENSPD